MKNKNKYIILNGKPVDMSTVRSYGLHGEKLMVDGISYPGVSTEIAKGLINVLDRFSHDQRS